MGFRAAALKRTYYDPAGPGSFGGRRALSLAARAPQHDVRRWLRGQEAYTLHKPVRYRFPRRATKVGGPHEQYQMDLLDTSAYRRSNRNVRFLLVVIDVFTKYAWAMPLKNKTGAAVERALTKVLNSPPARLRLETVQSDKGKEFVNARVQGLLKRKGVRFFTSENDDIKASVVERFNRTLQTRIHRYMTHNKTDRYVAALADILNGYNNRTHGSTGFTPQYLTDCTTTGVWPGPTTKDDVWHRLYDDRTTDYWRVAVRPTEKYYAAWRKTHEKPQLKRAPPAKAALKVGDFVRISKSRKIFRKGHAAGWSKELFNVTRIQRTKPVTYRIADQAHEPVEGSFYAQELQKVDPPEYHDVEKIVKRRETKRGPQYLVKWSGYADAYNSWVDGRSLKDFR